MLQGGSCSGDDFSHTIKFFSTRARESTRAKKNREESGIDADAIASRRYASQRRPILRSSDFVIAEVRSLHRRAASGLRRRRVCEICDTPTPSTFACELLRTTILNLRIRHARRTFPVGQPGGVIVHARARLESKAHAGRANSMESIGWSELRRAKTRNDVARRQRYFARPRPDRQKQRRAGLDELRSRTFYPSFQELVQLRGGSVVEPPFALLQEQVEMLAGDPVIPPQVPRGLAPEILNLVDPRAASHQAP